MFLERQMLQEMIQAYRTAYRVVHTTYRPQTVLYDHTLDRILDTDRQNDSTYSSTTDGPQS